MKKIIITGSAGLVGLNMITLLDKKRYDIVAIDKNPSNLGIIEKIDPEVKRVCADLSVPDDGWEKHFKDAYCVIQLQAQISSPSTEPYFKNNVESVRNVLSACEKYRIKRLIHASSSVVISVSNDLYTQTKSIGEGLVKDSKVPYTILRPSLMYGCFDIKHLDPLVRILDKSPVFPVPGKGDFIRQPLYVKDFARIIISCIEKRPLNKIYNIIGKEEIDFIELVKRMARKKGKKGIFINIPIPLFIQLLKIYGVLIGKMSYVPSQLNALIAGDIFPVIDWDNTFGVRYTSFDEGVKDMLESRYYNYVRYMKK